MPSSTPNPIYDRGMLPEVVFALVIVSMLATSEPSSKDKCGLDEDIRKGQQALSTRIDALLDTALNTCDKIPAVSDDEVDAELARRSVRTARAVPSSAHSDCTDLEIQTELSECSDVPSVDLPAFTWRDFPVFCSDDSDDESFMPESACVALEVYGEQSFASKQSTFEPSPGLEWSSVDSYDPDPQNP